MNKVITLAQVRERESDPSTWDGPQARIAEAGARLDPHWPRMRALVSEARKTPDLARKIQLFRDLAEIVIDAMRGISACSRVTCSHCCNTPVLVTRVEAGVIAKEIGVPVRNIKCNPRTNPDYIGKPCPFLDDGKCSIYASRPLACRLQFNLDADDLLCHLFEGETIRVPYFNTTEYRMLEVQAIGLEHAKAISDIRDFFPRGKSKLPTNRKK